MLDLLAKNPLLVIVQLYDNSASVSSVLLSVSMVGAMFPVCVRRFASAARDLPLLKPSDALARWRDALPPAAASSVLAGYTSALGGIVTDPSLLMVPFDDHGFHRGHCVFDTVNVEAGRAFGLQMHIDRLLNSARLAKIIGEVPPPAAEPSVLRSIILQTIAATGRRDGIFVRYWLSAGRGDFSISPKRCAGPTFYCVVHEDTHTAEGARGVSAVTVSVPLKPPLLATMKSNNYMLNALVAMEAEAAGASMGLQLDEDGHLAESSVAVGGLHRTWHWRTAPPLAVRDAKFSAAVADARVSCASCSARRLSPSSTGTACCARRWPTPFCLRRPGRAPWPSLLPSSAQACSAAATSVRSPRPSLSRRAALPKPSPAALSPRPAPQLTPRRVAQAGERVAFARRRVGGADYRVGRTAGG